MADYERNLLISGIGDSEFDRPSTRRISRVAIDRESYDVQNLSLQGIWDAAAAAPANWAAVPFMSSPPTVTYSSANAVPSLPGGGTWKRYWIAGSGGIGNSGDGGAVLRDKVDTFRRLAQKATFNGAVNFSSNDGSSTQWWSVRENLELPYGKDGDLSPWYWGFTFTGRSFGIPVQSFTAITLIVDGQRTQRWESTGHGDAYAYFDFGTAATRNIVVVIDPDAWAAELVVPTAATVTPYSSWRDGRIKDAFLGDSYLQAAMSTSYGVSFAEAISELTGGATTVNNSMGGTGYSSDNNNSSVTAFNNPQRLNALLLGAPDRIWVMGGINDGWPTSTIVGGNANTAEMLDRTWDNIRAANPDAMLMFVTPWAPNETNGQNPAGTAQQIRAKMIAKLATFPGPWVFIDFLAGSWSTSAGTQKATATGPLITGTGWKNNPQLDGNADTWIGGTDGDDNTHPTPDVGYPGILQAIADETRDAYASMEGGDSYSLTADTGSYALTGQSVALKFGHLLAAASATFTLTGIAANLKRGYPLIAASGTFALTGQSAALRATRRLVAASGTYTLTGQAAGLTHGYKLTAAAGSYSLTGTAAGLKFGHVVKAAAGSFTLTGQAAGLKRGLRLPAAAGAYTLTGVAASLRRGYQLAAGQGSYTLTGMSATLGNAKTLTADAVSYALTGRSAILLHARRIGAEVASFVFTGQAAGLLASRRLLAEAASFGLSGTDGALSAQRHMAAASGSFALTGRPVTLTKSGEEDYEAIAAAVWAYVLPNGKTAAETAVETLALLENMTTLDTPIEGTFTGADLLRIIAAVQAGKTTITPTAPNEATVTFEAVDDSELRVSAEMVGSERVSVTITP